MKSNNKKGISPRLAHSLSMAASEVGDAKKEMRATPEAIKYSEKQEEFTKKIITAANAAKTVEDLVYLEMALQEMDRELAHTEQEQGSIDKAQRDYRELVHTIDQMRRAPGEYLEANLSISSLDIKKMPDVRGPAKIKSNLARLQNRSMFAEEEDRKVWDARIAMANKTGSMLKDLHKNLMAETERA